MPKFYIERDSAHVTDSLELRQVNTLFPDEPSDGFALINGTKFKERTENNIEVNFYPLNKEQAIELAQYIANAYDLTLSTK